MGFVALLQPTTRGQCTVFGFDSRGPSGVVRLWFTRTLAVLVPLVFQSVHTLPATLTELMS